MSSPFFTHSTIIPGPVRGTTTNDSAEAGFVGEYIVGTQTTPTNFPTTTQYGDLTSISLTAGDWDVAGYIHGTANGATVLSQLAGISTTSGNSATGLVSAQNQAVGAPGPSVNSGVTTGIASYRVSITATTTIYLKYFASYSVATPQAVGRLSARRVR